MTPQIALFPRPHCPGERDAFFAEDRRRVIQRHGAGREEAWFAVSCSPVPDPAAAGGIGGVLVTTFETTERVRNEARLQRLTQGLEADIEQRTRERDRIWQVSEDLLGVTTFDGCFISMNPAWTNLLGWTEDEIRSMHVSELRHPDDAAAAIAGRQRLAGGVPTVRMENRFRHKNGSWRWIAWTMTADEGLIYVAGRHVTAEKQAAEALRETERQRAQLQKMDALGQLTGGVSHDFNNLLMIIGGNVPRIKKAVADDPKATRAAQAIEIAAQRGEALTRQLLTFSRRQAFNPVVVSVDECISSFRPVLTSTIGASARLLATIPPDIWPVKVDAGELELVLVNLTLNSRDALPQGGIITVAAENAHLSAGNTPEGLEGDFVALRVCDTGSGIPPDILPKVFDPFFTTKGVDKGTGLGLSQVHGFAHQSGGAVVIASHMGEGTTVTMYLPRARRDREPVAARSQDGNAGGTVLLVEDNPDVAEVTWEMLRHLGYDVQLASNAHRALEIVDRHEVDIVVSDIVMAGAMDGLDLARAIRDCAADLPILLVTGYAATAARAAAEFTVLRKPFQVADLSRAASRAVAERRRG